MGILKQSIFMSTMNSLLQNKQINLLKQYNRFKMKLIQIIDITKNIYLFIKKNFTKKKREYNFCDTII